MGMSLEEERNRLTGLQKRTHDGDGEPSKD